MVSRDKKAKNRESQPQPPTKEVEKPNLDLSEIPEEFAEVIEAIPKEKREKVTALLLSITQQRSMSYRGIVPHPEILKGFNEEVKDGAERTFIMAEKQMAHRIETEKQVVTEQLSQSKRGQIFGFILGILGLTLSTTLGVLGHDWLAGVFATTTIGGLVSTFVIGKNAQAQDLKQKK